MKKLLLSFVLAGSFVAAQAQCTPDPLAFLPLSPSPNDTLYATVGQPYAQTLTISVPQDTTLTLPPIPPLFPGGTFTVQVLKQTITSIDGLPTGITTACNTAGCTWVGGQKGCVQISGTANTAGTYTVNVNLSTLVSDPAPGISIPSTPVPIPYTMIVKVGTGIDDVLDENAFRFAACEPTVASDFTTLKFSYPLPQSLQFSVYDMAGKQVQSETLAAQAGINQQNLYVGNLAKGVYTLTLQDKTRTLVQKLIVE